jgi:hypothetical protein
VFAALASGSAVVLRAEYVDSLGFLATLAYRMLGSDTGDIDRNALRTYDRYVFPVSRAADGVLRYVLGKNALVIARRDA